MPDAMGRGDLKLRSQIRQLLVRRNKKKMGLKIQMLVVNDSAICPGRMGSGLLSPYTSEHFTLAGGNEAIPEPTPRDPG